MLLSAGLPVAAAYVTNWAVANRFGVHDYLGESPDGTPTFAADATTDYGLILNITHPITCKANLALVGLGALGLRRQPTSCKLNARMLVQLFGGARLARLRHLSK